MRDLVSSSCLLFQIIAILAVFATVSGTILCGQLNENEELIPQMENCQDQMFAFLPSAKNHTFDLSSLSQEQANKILYLKKPDGTPNLNKPKSIKGNIQIIDSQLEHLNLVISNLAKPQTVQITGNTKFRSLELSETSPLEKLTLTVRGNKQLSMLDINTLNKLTIFDRSTSTIQEYRECSFNGKALGNLADLQGCKRIYGDLIIDQSTSIPSTTPTIRIKKIENGCVKIENSALQDSKFLEDLFKDQMACTAGKHVIKNNKNLCLTSEKRQEWTAAGFEIIYTGTCPDRCKVDFAIKNQDATKAPCDVVVGDVKIAGEVRRRRQSVTPTSLAHWDRVKELEGTLEIDGTSLKEIRIFKNLKKIVNPSPEKIALTVIKNSAMTKFDLPELKNITMSPDAWAEPIFFSRNGDFYFTSDEAARWTGIAGGKTLRIPLEEVPVTTAATLAPDGPTPMSAEEVDDLNQKIIKENAEIESNRRRAIIVIGVFVGLFFLVIVIIVGCCFCWAKIGKLEEDKIDLKKGKSLTKPVNEEKLEKNKDSTSTSSRSSKSTKQELTMAGAVDLKQFKLSSTVTAILEEDLDSIQNRQEITRAQMCLVAEEIPFKMTDMIADINAPELDFERAQKLLKEAPLPKMAFNPKPYRHLNNYKIVFFNPTEGNGKNPPYIKEYDRWTVFKYLVTNCTEFFLTNAHLLAATLLDCRGFHYSPNKSLLVEIEGPVYVIGDIHEALHVVQTIFNLDLDGDGKKHKIHPMFRHKYLFLGDYLDKGECGLEVYLLLCLAARLFPENFTILRGNHDGSLPDKNNDEAATVNAYARALEEWTKDKRIGQPLPAGPLHFAEDRLKFLYTNITPYLPMVAVVNGYTFAAHGGFTLNMAITKKSIRDIFQTVPVPYYNKSEYYQDSCSRYYKDDSYKSDWKRLDEAQSDPHWPTFMNDLGNWRASKNAYLEHKELYPNGMVNYDFESRFPLLNTIMWSDPSHALASAGNQRGAGCIYNIELVRKMMNNNKATETTKSIEDIIRAHQMIGYAQHCDHRVTTVFTNCNHVLDYSENIEDLKCPTDLMRCSAILRINEDGTRTVIFLSMTTEKKADQALANPKRKFKRTTLGLPAKKVVPGNKDSESKPQDEKEEKPSDNKKPPKPEEAAKPGEKGEKPGNDKDKPELESTQPEEDNEKPGDNKNKPKVEEPTKPGESKGPEQSNTSKNMQKENENSTPNKDTANEKQPEKPKETKEPKEEDNILGKAARKAPASGKHGVFFKSLSEKRMEKPKETKEPKEQDNLSKKNSTANKNSKCKGARKSSTSGKHMSMEQKSSNKSSQSSQYGRHKNATARD